MRKTLLLLALAAATSLAAQSRTGRDYAVFFYVTDFQPGWQALPETRDEALKLKTELEAHFGFMVTLVANPTRRQILDALRAWNDRLGPTDQILYFFSMHGYYDRAGDRGYLVPADGKTLKQDPYFDTWLSYDDLRTNFARCPARHLLVAFDACYSGAFGIRMKSPDEPVYDEKADCATRRAFPFQYRSRQFLTSGNAETKTPARSLFADKLLETLRKAPQNEGLVFFDDLLYALGKIPTPRPEGGTFGAHEAAGGFVFARRDACKSVTPLAPTPSGESDAVQDLAAWTKADAIKTEAAYYAYLKNFPNGAFREAAEAKIDALKKAAQSNSSSGKPIEPPAGDDRPAAPDLSAYGFRPDDFALVRGGTFKMGSEDSEAQSDEKPVHDVTISDFYLGRHEITLAQFKRFIDDSGYKTDAEKENKSYAYNGKKFEWMPGVNWRHDERGNIRPTNQYNYPVIHISWNDAAAYAEWLSRKTGQTYRLPTEAEWEYAAGNGAKHTRYSWGNDAPAGKNGGNVGDETAKKHFPDWTVFAGYYDGYLYAAPVGSFTANEFGLYDMTGNVWEWCADWYGDYPASAQTNPSGPSSGSSRVFRGGSWYGVPRHCRVAFRVSISPSLRYSNVGFRLARTF